MARRQAVKHRIFVHAGSIMERIEGEERIHNTSVVFNRQGEEIARYRKIHLFDVTTPDGAAYKESATVKAGDHVVTYDCEGVTIGCSICYDLRFPDPFQALAEKGAEIIALPAAFTLQTGRDHWEVLLRARAIETETYVCASAQTAPSPSATSSATLRAIPSSPTPGAPWSPGPPTGRASSPHASTRKGSSGCAL
jgi:nitrilase